MCFLRMAIVFLLALLLCLAVFSQPVLSPIDPIPLVVGYEQTTNIVFPSAVESVDRGNGMIAVQKARGSDRILHLKAAQKMFTPTNLSVVTRDGQLYSFLVRYVDAPPVLNLVIAEDHYASLASRLRDQPARHRVRARHQSIQLRLLNLFVDTTALWFHFKLSNRSAVGFDPGSVRFSIREKHTPRRTAVQEKERPLVYVDRLRPVLANWPVSFCVALRPFTLQPSQRLYVQVSDRHGERTVTLRVRYPTLAHAASLH